MSASAKKALAEAAARGFTLMKNGEKIVYFGPPDAMTEDLAASLRARRAELLRVLPDENEKADADKAPRQPDSQAPAGARGSTSNQASNRDRTGCATYTNYSAGYPDAKPPEPMPLPDVAWPTDLSVLLRRVSTAFEWTDQDRRDFVAWARRDQQGIDDARAFLEAEFAKLAAPGRADRRREVLDRLAADPDLRVAWTCSDDGADPVVLVLAIRCAGTVEMAIPREKFNPLALPMLIEGLVAAQEAAK